jgi:hypothetical protein
MSIFTAYARATLAAKTRRATLARVRDQRLRAGVLSIAGCFLVCACAASWSACAGLRASSLPSDGGANDDVIANEAGSDASADMDASSTFTLMNSVPQGETFQGIWGANPTTLFVVGTNGLHYDHANGSWTVTQVAIGVDYYAVWGLSATDVYAVGTVRGTQTGVVEHNDGTGWVEFYTTPTPLYGVWGGSDFVIAVGAQGMLYGYMTGSGWTTFPALPANTKVDAGSNGPTLWSIAGKDVYHFAMAADLDRIFQYDQAGDFINYDPAPDRGIDFRTVWATPGATPSYFFGTNNFGIAWLTSDDLPDASVLTQGLYSLYSDQSQLGSDQLYIRAIWGAQNTMFAGDQGTILEYVAVSNRIEQVNAPVGFAADLYAMWGSSLNDIWIVGEDETILHGSAPYQ